MAANGEASQELMRLIRGYYTSRWLAFRPREISQSLWMGCWCQHTIAVEWKLPSTLCQIDCIDLSWLWCCFGDWFGWFVMNSLESFGGWLVYCTLRNHQEERVDVRIPRTIYCWSWYEQDGVSSDSYHLRNGSIPGHGFRIEIIGDDLSFHFVWFFISLLGSLSKFAHCSLLRIPTSDCNCILYYINDE